MGRSGMCHYHCLVRHVFLKVPQLYASFLWNFKSLSCIWHWVAKNSEFNDCLSLIINRGAWIPNFQWSAAEDWRGPLWWHLIKTFKKPSQSSDSIEAWFGYVDGQMPAPQTAYKENPSWEFSRAAKYTDMEGRCMPQVDNNIGSFVWSFFYKPLFQKILVHTEVKAKECLNK